MIMLEKSVSTSVNIILKERKLDEQYIHKYIWYIDNLMKNEKFKNNKDLKICLIMQSNHLIEYSNILSRLLYLEQYKKNPIKNLAKLIDKNLLDDEILKLTNETKFYL